MSDTSPLSSGQPLFPLKKVFNAFGDSLIAILALTVVTTLLAVWGYPTAAKTIAYFLCGPLAVFNFFAGILLVFKLLMSAPAFFGGLAQIVKAKFGTR